MPPKLKFYVFSALDSSGRPFSFFIKSPNVDEAYEEWFKEQLATGEKFVVMNIFSE